MSRISWQVTGLVVAVAAAAALTLSALSLGITDRIEDRDESLDTAAAVLAELPEPRLVAVESGVRRGHSTTLVLHPAPGVRALSVALEDDDGETLSRAGGFQVFPLRDVPVWAAKLGIPDDLEAGEYTVRAIALRDEEAVEFSTSLEVQDYEFHSMEIALSPAMTSLRRDPDPERVEQARELRALLASHRQEGLYYKGKLEIPVEYRRRSAGYGDRRVYRYHDGDTATAVHAGIDMAAPTGKPVKAAGGGRVSLSEDRLISGNSVVIEHLPGVYSIYYHLDELAVSEGDIVRRGEQIGTVGATGLVTGPHLHWELRVGGVAVDPDQFVEEPLVDKVSIFSTIMDILRAQDESGVEHDERG